MSSSWLNRGRAESERTEVLALNARIDRLMGDIRVFSEKLRKHATSDFNGWQDGISISAKFAFLNALDALLGEVERNKYNAPDQIFEYRLGPMVAILEEIERISWFEKHADELWECALLGVFIIVEKQYPGDWDFSDSVSDAFDVLSEMIRVWAGSIWLNIRARELLSDPRVFGLQSFHHVEAKVAFPPKKAHVLIPMTLRRVLSLGMGTEIEAAKPSHLQNAKRPKVGEKVVPSARELESRKIRLLTHFAIGAFDRGEYEACSADLDEIFRIIQSGNPDNSRYFYQSVEKFRRMLHGSEKIFMRFVNMARDMRDPESRAYTLAELAKIHFTLHKDPDRVLSLLSQDARHMDFSYIAAFVSEVIVHVAAHIDPKVPDIQRDSMIERLLAILESMPSERAVAMEAIFEAASAFVWQKRLQARCYKHIAESLHQYELLCDRVDAEIRLARVWYEWRDISDVLKKWNSEIYSVMPRKGEYGWELEFTRAAEVLVGQYALLWAHGEISKIVEDIQKNFSYPNDHVRDVLWAAICGYAVSADLERIADCIKRTPKNIRWANVNRAVVSLAQNRKYDEAWSFIQGRAFTQDSNVLSDSPSSLVNRVIMSSYEQGDLEVTRMFLGRVFEYPIDSYSFEKIFDLYERNPTFFPEGYLLRLLEFASTHYTAWVVWSHQKTILGILRKLPRELFQAYADNGGSSTSTKWVLALTSIQTTSALSHPSA